MMILARRYISAAASTISAYLKMFMNLPTECISWLVTLEMSSAVITAAISCSSMSVISFFEKYPELQQCRILGVGPEEEPVIEIPYSIVLELTKDPMVSAVTWIENAQSEKVAVVGTIDGKNVYGASYASEDPFSVNDLPSDGSIDISQESLQAALRQMDDDEYIDVIVLPLASGKRMDEQLLYEESLRQGYEFGEEEMHEVKRDLFYEMVKEALEPIDYEGWVFLKDGTVDDYYPLYYREYAVRKEQLLNLELPANACFGYRVFWTDYKGDGT